MKFCYSQGTVILLVVTCVLVVLTKSCAPRGRIIQGTEASSIHVWEEVSDQGMPIIRVLLNQPSGEQRVNVNSNRSYRIQKLNQPEVSTMVTPEKTVTFDRQGDQLFVEGKSFSKPVVFQVKTSENGILKIGDRKYRGNLRIYINNSAPESVDEGGLLVINHIPINKYLWSVLGGELLPDWTGQSINRTQAVAGRTYTFYEMEERAKKREGRFDLYDSTGSQVYKGVQGERPSTKEAVQETIGEVMVFEEDKLVPAYYSSTCGGHTSPPRPNFSWYEGPPVPPPLAGVDCPWDDVSKHHRWEAQVSGSTLKQALFPGTGAESVYDMAVQERISEGRAETVAFRLSSGQVKTMSGPAFRMAMARYRSSLSSESRKDRVWIRSTKFRVKKSDNGQFRFRGKGWGHGVGLCQYGAFGASQEGYEYREILQHYYRNASVEQHYPLQQ